MKSARLSKLLTNIQKQLVSDLPEAVRKLRIKSPAYCLFIWYQDSSTDEYTPQFFVAPVRLRDACLAEKDLSKIGGDALDAVWRPQQTISFPYQKCRFSTNLCDSVSAEANECCSILFDNPSDEEDGDESALLMPFRTALHRAARELNGFDWSGVLPRSDDFIVLATDYIGYWLAEDMTASVPKKQLSLLVSHGYLPKDMLEYDPKAEQAKYEAEEAAQKKAVQDRVEADLRDAKRVHQEKVKAGEACPKCGFTFGWNGSECTHCKFRK
jgi:hypothetical protein